MKKAQKTKTAVLPQRAMDKVSPWIMPQKQVISKEFTGWHGSMEIISVEGKGNVTRITVTSSVELGARHSRMFYLASRIAANNKDNRGVVHVDEILKDLGIKIRPENRNKVATTMRECMGMVITIEQDGLEHSFHLLENSRYKKDAKVIEFRVSEEYYEATKVFKQRYINTSAVMKLRENNEVAIELATYLQLRGRGVDGKTGEPLPAQKVYHEDITLYLHLISNTAKENRRRVIRRAFDALHKQGYPKYKYVVENGCEFWTCNTKANPAKRYKSGDIS